MRHHADASRPAIRERAEVNVHARTLSEPPKRKVSLSASWSLAGDLQSPYLDCDPRQGREVLGQAEPYRKWHSCAFRDIRCLRETWKREHRREYMHERPFRSKFPQRGQIRPSVSGCGYNPLNLRRNGAVPERERERERGGGRGGKEERKADELTMLSAYRAESRATRPDGDRRTIGNHAF